MPRSHALIAVPAVWAGELAATPGACAGRWRNARCPALRGGASKIGEGEQTCSAAHPARAGECLGDDRSDFATGDARGWSGRSLNCTSSSRNYACAGSLSDGLDRALPIFAGLFAATSIPNRATGGVFGRLSMNSTRHGTCGREPACRRATRCQGNRTTGIAAWKSFFWKRARSVPICTQMEADSPS